VSGNHGGKDYWVVKLDPSGNKTWQKCLGGSGDDEASSVRQTADGGYMVAGQTNSSDGIVSGNHGGKDYWVVKLNESGHLVWQRCLGGSQDDYAKDVRQTADGGYVVAGFANSNNGDVSGNHGGEDFWIVKLDQSGNLTWQKCLGGKFGEPGKPGEQAWSIQQTSDGGYVVAGNAASPDGDVGGTHGKLNYSDYWVVKLDPSGNWVWKKCLGGRYIDEARSIQQTADGGYVVAGYSYSDDGNATGNHGNTKDYWVVKLDSLGSLSWQRSLGGFNNEEAYSVNQTADGGYIVAGYTNSNDGDVIGKHKAKDLWVVRLDPSGRLLWQDCLGGSSDEEARSVQRTADGGHVVAGATASNDGDVSGNHGGLDFWVVKLREINCTITAPDSICAGSTGNLASTAESGAAYAWSITNGEITSANDTQSITFTAGSSGTLKLKVTVTAKGCMKECSKDITVTAEPDCSWTSNAPVCNGTPVQFTGPAGMAAYQWDFGDGAVSSARDPSHLYSAPGTHTVNLKVTAADGCSKNCTKDITVTAEPDCTISAPSSICAGSTGNSASTATSGAAYAWSITNGNITSASNTQSITFTAGAPGAVGLKVKVTNADGCAKECSKDITVTAMPDCTISAPDSVCAGSTGNAASTATPGAAYTWSITNGNITSASNTQSITFTAGAAGTTRLEVKVTTADGCSKSCIKDISITQGPDCTISAPDSVCAGSTGNTASTATSGAAYAWSITNGQITSAPTDQSITFTAGSSGTTTLKVKVTAGGCSKECTKDITITSGPDCTISATAAVCAGSTGNAASTAAAGAAYSWSITNGQITSVSNTQSIVFAAGATGTTRLEVTVTAGSCSKKCSKNIAIISAPDCSWTSSSPVCDGTPVQFTGPSGMDSYYWELGDGAVSSAKDPSHQYSAPGTYTITLKATKSGCSKSCTGSVEVKPMPDCSWTSNSPVNNGTPVQFTGPAGMGAYQWDFGDGSGSTDQSPSHKYSKAGSYNVSLTMCKEGCSKTCIGSVVVKSQCGDCWCSNSPVCNGTPVEFDGPSGIDSYVWDFGDGQVSTSEDPSHLYSAPGKYLIVLVVEKDNHFRSCPDDVAVKPLANCSTTLNVPAPSGTAAQLAAPSGIGSNPGGIGGGQVSSRENRVRIYPG
jgi:PKD repeat protein